MFKKIAAEALGLSDIGAVIGPEDYDKTDADDYVMNEEGEKIYFLIKSKTDEYCFTNVAFIHVDGTSALSKKRTLRRHEYYKNPFSNVLLETAGTVDLDAEIKFDLGGEDYSVDVHKKFIEPLKDLYKTLLRIAALQREEAIARDYADKSLETAVRTFGSARVDGGNLEQQFKAVNQYAFDWMTEARKNYTRKDFGEIFEKFIND